MGWRSWLLSLLLKVQSTVRSFDGVAKAMTRRGSLVLNGDRFFYLWLPFSFSWTRCCMPRLMTTESPKLLLDIPTDASRTSAEDGVPSFGKAKNVAAAFSACPSLARVSSTRNFTWGVFPGWYDRRTARGEFCQRMAFKTCACLLSWCTTHSG